MKGNIEYSIGFWVIAGVTLLVVATMTTIADVLDTNHSDRAWAGVIIIPSMPSFILYVLITGDIHGWTRSDRTSGRIIVTTLRSWIFWTPIVYWIFKKTQKMKLRLHRPKFVRACYFF